MIFMIARSPRRRWWKAAAPTMIGIMSSAAPPPLFDAIDVFDSGMLAVGDGHQLYYEQCGARDGMPLLFLHGGPGSGCSARHRQLHDPARFRSILFDQRGCGRSTPRGSLAANTTARLLADIEALRAHLGIERWLVHGGSWGSTLALAYCAAHRDACLGAILRGIFLGGRADLDWFFHDAGAVLAADWQGLLAPLPAALRAQPQAAAIRVFYLDALLGGDRSLAARAVSAWMQWEAALTSPLRAVAGPTPPAGPALELALDKYRIQAHYLAHECFLGADAVLDCAARLQGLPVALLHGRLDLVCRSINALQVHRALPGSRLRIVDEAGHSPFDPAMSAALIGACAHFHTHRDFATWGHAAAA